MNPLNLSDFQNLPILQNLKSKPSKITALQEEASSRRYYLLEFLDQTPLVFCDAETEQSDFINVGEFLRENKIPVPKVHHKNSENTQLIVSLEGIKDLSNLSEKEYLDYLPKAIDLIIKLQLLKPIPPVEHRFFDFEKLFWEVNHTFKGLEIYLSYRNFSIEVPIPFQAFLEETCLYLNQYSKSVFCHRDYHCRNLLLDENNSIKIIDFQDARMGNHGYDLSSLLYDAYKPIPLKFRKELISYYRNQAVKSNIHLPKDFLEIYYLQALQRSFKALGTYFHMASKGKSKFEKSISPCLDNLIEISQVALLPDSVYLFFTELKEKMNPLN